MPSIHKMANELLKEALQKLCVMQVREQRGHEQCCEVQQKDKDRKPRKRYRQPMQEWPE